MPRYPSCRGLTVALALAALTASACGGRSSGSTAVSYADPPPTATAAPSVDPDTSSASNQSLGGGTRSFAPPATPTPVREFGSPLGSALGLPRAERAAPQPIGLSYPAIGVESAPVDMVGVEPSGEMEIPGAEAIGWYQHGPSPGEDGSAVLAAHIAFDGVDGVFRDLNDAKAGDEFTVVFDDGSEADFAVVERAQYDKTNLPFDRVFARSGPPIVTLVSCGGDFQPSLRSYEDNIVVYAAPADDIEGLS